MGMHCPVGFRYLYFGCYYLSLKMPHTKSWFDLFRVAASIANIALRRCEIQILYLLLVTVALSFHSDAFILVKKMVLN